MDLSPTRVRQLPLYRAVMQEPLLAPQRAHMLADELGAVAASPAALMGVLAVMGGTSAGARPLAALPDARLGDSLAVTMAILQAAAGTADPYAVPSPAALPEPLRGRLAHLLRAIARAEQERRRAFAAFPPIVTPADLIAQVLDDIAPPDATLDFRTLLLQVDRDALSNGMQALSTATDAFVRWLQAEHSPPRLPSVAVAFDTPLGPVSIDTTGRSNMYRQADHLVLIDVGGDDFYAFARRAAERRISVLIDHGGNDRYTAAEPDADPSSAVMGYGILWDTGGDDRYRAKDLAQGAALFGAGLLVDDGGHNRFDAQRYSQAFALGGIALLRGSPGNDEYHALSHAQASGGPEGVAVLVEPGGDDRYVLGNTPLISPSPQLPDRNTSMGQGAGRGLRATVNGAPSATGGVGVLLDMAGDDEYRAQVFAQGVGYYEGLGMLIDRAGADRYLAAWYAMGASAHRGAGVLLDLGAGNDAYAATHSTSLGAAHDFSVAVFMDEAGEDSYELGDLGMGAAHDHSAAVFVDGAGRNRYRAHAESPRVFGTAHLSPDADPDDGPAFNGALFVDATRCVVSTAPQNQAGTDPATDLALEHLCQHALDSLLPRRQAQAEGVLKALRVEP